MDDPRIAQLHALIEQVRKLKETADALVEELTARIRESKAQHPQKSPKDRRRKPRQ